MTRTRASTCIHRAGGEPEWACALQLYQFTKAIQADLDTAGLKGKGGNWYSTKCMIPSNARIIDFVVSDKDLQASFLPSWHL